MSSFCISICLLTVFSYSSEADEANTIGSLIGHYRKTLDIYNDLLDLYSDLETRPPSHEIQSEASQFPDKLFTAYPWPSEQRFEPFYQSLGGGGRRYITNLTNMYSDDKLVMLEIGGFLGGSMANWLKHNPNMVAVLLEMDYFGDHGSTLAHQIEQIHHVGEWMSGGILGCCRAAIPFLPNIRQVDGAAHTLFSNLWQFKDRLVISFDSAPVGLHKLHRLGFRPDIIYIDTDKYFDELWVAHSLWPGALLTGDDWTWAGTDMMVPVVPVGGVQQSQTLSARRGRDPILRFTKKYNYTLRAVKDQWAIFSPHVYRELWRKPPKRPRGQSIKYFEIP